MAKFPLKSLTCLPVSYIESRDACLFVLHAFQRDEQLVTAYGGGQDLVKFKMQAHGKGNRLMLLGQKPAQQDCQGEEPVCQQ